MARPSSHDRLAALEARVLALESAAAVHEPQETPPEQDRERAVVSTDVFWALEGLSARSDEPGAVMIVGDVTTPAGVTARWQEGASTDDLMHDEWSRMADRLAALGHPVRLQLLQHVLRGVDTARELAEIEGIGTSGQVYHHLRQLTAAGWLRNRGARYEVPAEVIVPLLTTMLGARR